MSAHLFIIWQYFVYKIKARHRNGHGIHSPFIFELVSRVIFDKTRYEDYHFFGEVRKVLLNSSEIIKVEDAGETSRYFETADRKIKDLVKHSSVRPKYAKLLYRLSHYYKPATIVEFGTSVGLSTLYLAKGNQKAKVITVEENSSLCDIAEKTWKEYKIRNISVRNELFDVVLGDLSQQLIEPVLVFIDGNHNLKSTIQYFIYFAEHVKDGIIVVDDIHWSKDMVRAWGEIIQQRKGHATIELFTMGIIVLKEGISPGNYVVNF